MNGSRMIQVLKRDGSAEPFEARKIMSAMWRAIGGDIDSFRQAQTLAEALHFYLIRKCVPCISSAAIFEMSIRLLQHAGKRQATLRLQAHWSKRQSRRRQLRVRHDNARITLWDKAWLAQWAQRSWNISLPTAKLLAAQVEEELLNGPSQEVTRQHVIDLLNDLVSAYGLADAVPSTI